jgi:hypothetical protein
LVTGVRCLRVLGPQRSAICQGSSWTLHARRCPHSLSVSRAADTRAVLSRARRAGTSPDDRIVATTIAQSKGSRQGQLRSRRWSVRTDFGYRRTATSACCRRARKVASAVGSLVLPRSPGPRESLRLAAPSAGSTCSPPQFRRRHEVILSQVSPPWSEQAPERPPEWLHSPSWHSTIEPFPFGKFSMHWCVEQN